MPYDEKLLEMLSSSVPQIRIMAMEQVSGLTNLSPEIIQALVNNSQDGNPTIAEKAKQLLHAIPQPVPLPVSQQVVQKETEKSDKQKDPPADHPAAPSVQHAASSEDYHDTFPSPPAYSSQPAFVSLQIALGVTFVICCLILYSYSSQILTLNINYGYTWLFAGLYLLFIVLQVISIYKFGFLRSFTYLKVIVLFFFSGRGRSRNR